MWRQRCHLWRHRCRFCWQACIFGVIGMYADIGARLRCNTCNPCWERCRLMAETLTLCLCVCVCAGVQTEGGREDWGRSALKQLQL